MKKEKKTQVVMLLTNSISKPVIIQGVVPNLIRQTKDVINEEEWRKFGKPQHLYFTNRDEINEGDYFLFNNTFVIKAEVYKNGRWYSKDFLQVYIEELCEKIIASTDESLELPRPSNSFIQKYVEEYNKGNIITEVMVEYEKETYLARFKHNNKDNWGERFNLKLKPDNTIIISAVEETWDDIVNSFLKAYNEQSFNYRAENTPTFALVEFLKDTYQVPKQIK